MFLYELIELGSTIVTEDHRVYLSSSSCLGVDSPKKDVFCGCALGTAFAAIAGIQLDGSKLFFVGSEIKQKLEEHLVDDIELSCPVQSRSECGTGIAHGILWMVDHLHAFHDWSRQQIADWLKPIEQAHFQKRQQQTRQQDELVTSRS